MYFFDTCFLLNNVIDIFNKYSHIYISSITINELEDIKNSFNKSEEVKYKARLLLSQLDKNEDKYTLVLYKNSYLKAMKKFDFPETNDIKIIATAYTLFKSKGSKEENFFLTDDNTCRKYAEAVGLNVIYSKQQEKVEYKGYKEINFNDEQLADFYSSVHKFNKNPFNLLENEYLIVKLKNDYVDKYKWTKEGYKTVHTPKIHSTFFGDIVPCKGDYYQCCAIDSLKTNQITVLRGKAGSGKSYLGLGYLVSLYEKGKIDKIIIFCNTVAVRGAAKLGFYPGDKDAKLLDSQIGNFLVSKFGSITEVEKMIASGSLILVPAADCRGMDTTGMNAGIYVTEAQNSTVDLMKLILQRIGEDSICVIEGDDKSQVDMAEYSGLNNGLRRISEVFRGEPYYGEVTLQTCYRSKIATRAEMM